MPCSTLYNDQLGDMTCLFWPNIWAGRGSEPVGRRALESSPKVYPMSMTRGIEWCPRLTMDPPKKWLAPPPPLKKGFLK